MGPVGGHIIDCLIPWYASLVGVIMLALFQSVQLGAGGIHIAAVIVCAFGLDVFRQMLEVSLTTAIFGYGFRHLSQFTLRSHPPPRISTSARARLNAVSILCVRNICLHKSWFKIIPFADFYRAGHRVISGHPHIHELWLACWRSVVYGLLRLGNLPCIDSWTPLQTIYLVRL